ncbi:peptigoglycan-binding protein LysM [Streptomyces sp. SAT1]|uniref:transglycosylase family protein n=1 Tax=Streptomyces sp. SAT1 TaxID=1849967 RepID=UPI0007DE2EF3|nr:transglycosylase family protein [Streptomyces sp. SAT1]ANH91899.1 peptigoglycan-binding protein LysM [Streptomyces sp. SAT1]
MLSGNGRHRRPRQAPALLVAAGVTGSAIAIPLVAASGASAADGTTWDKVAQCETGGSWSADNGHGYYGGLMLTQDDWEAYGGLSYAASADQASRSQQIAVAEKILADKGPGAWHTCGLLAGLTKGSGTADVDTGVGGDSSASGADGSTSSDKGDKSGKDDKGDKDDKGSASSGTSGSTGKGGDSDGSGGSDASGKPRTGEGGLSDSPQDADNSSGSSGSSPDATETPGASHGTGASHGATTGPSDGPSAPGKTDGPAESGAGTPDATSSTGTGAGTPDQDRDNSGDADNYVQDVGSSALVDTGALGSGGRHRGGSADEGTADGAAGGRHASRGGGAHASSAGSYTVRTGDSLTSIADSFDLHGGWHALYDSNKGAIGADPDHIVAGQSLDVPAENAQK